MVTWFSVWDYSNDEPILLYGGDSFRKAIHVAQVFDEKVYHCIRASDGKVWTKEVWPLTEKDAECSEKFAM